MFDTFFKKSENSGHERYRKAMLTSLMNLAAQFVQLTTGLISVPLALNYVGVEQFGIWMALSTALAFITFTDFGIGIGVQDRMTRFVGSNSYDSARKSLFTSFGFVMLLFGILMIANQFLVPQLDLTSALSLKTQEAIDEIVPTTQMVVFVLGLGLLSGIVQRAFNALQEGFWVALIQVVARFASLILLFIVVDHKMGLPALVFVVGGLTSVGLIFFGIPVLLSRHRWLMPARLSSDEMIDRECLKGVLKVGILGLGASIAIYMVNNSIPVLISGKYGAEYIADYAVLLKLLSVPTLLLTYMLLPLWPAITEAKAKNDSQWIRSVYKKCSRITLVVTIGFSLFFLIFGRQIIFLWTDNKAVVPSYSLLIASVCFMVLGFWNTLTSVMLNGLSIYKSQAIYGLSLAVVFAFFASLIPATMEKYWIVWMVGLGYFARCLFMQIEINNFLRSDANQVL
jgi:O-antigen/teichoic acid export membrane protein